VTSGVGYAIWYAALGSLSSMQAAMVQLVVPVLAAAGGTILLSEVVSARLVVAGMLILGGICTAVFGKEKLRNVTGPG
jgi:drug/metabolite transporter (DMT)-like permease